MKKLTAVVLALALALALAGCGEDGYFVPDTGSARYVEGQDELLARLRELGAGLSEPISRSGVNHRLQRILEFAQALGVPGQEE